MASNILTSIDVINKMKKSGFDVPEETVKVTIELTCGELAKINYQTLVGEDRMEKIIKIIKNQDA